MANNESIERLESIARGAVQELEKHDAAKAKQYRRELNSASTVPIPRMARGTQSQLEAAVVELLEALKGDDKGAPDEKRIAEIERLVR